ncbi:major facilitator superfamily [Stylonychia lemnae]|uniref:Major facilitator superfamily n=1 Tax=Stylonychia lemnae TaxID=5949 RepID=A0A077ZNU1_STYLE|nr:major facilitator superfamily [Stylonychia lemnae]|eukprot:CDW71139.1 major facilitator superfamily [Stylonychia lemnae]
MLHPNISIDFQTTQANDLNEAKIYPQDDFELPHQAINKHDKSFDTTPNNILLFDKATYSNIILSIEGFFGFLTIALNLHTFCMNDTIIADHLMTTYNYQPWSIALIQAIQSVGFLLTTHIAPVVIKRFNLFAIVIVSQLIQSVGSFLVGPSLFFNIQEKIYITCIGLFISGLASPFNMVTSFSIMVQAAHKHRTKRFDPDQVKNLVSALFNSSYAIGGMTGPIFGGFVSEATSFRTASDFQAIVLISVALCQFFIVYIPRNFRFFKKEIKVEPVNTSQTFQRDATIIHIESYLE